MRFGKNKGDFKTTSLQHLSFKEQEYVLATGVDYVVGVNDKPDREVYLNPVVEDPQIPDESNIPWYLDRQLATAHNRNKIPIVVYSPDGNIPKILVDLKDREKRMNYYEEFFDWVNDVRGELVDMIDQQLQALDLDQIKKGVRLNDIILDVVNDQSAFEYTNSTINGENPDRLQIIRHNIDKLLGWLDKVIKTRVPDLKNLAEQDQMIIAFDTFSFDEEHPEEGFDLLTTYIPGNGWSVAFPCADCPQHAAAAIDGFLDGNIPQEFEVFIRSMDEEVRDGRVQIYRDSRIVVFNGVAHDNERFRHDQAVFHGKQPAQQAFETLRMACDPVDARSEMNPFKQVLLYDDSEFEDRIDQADKELIVIE